jgi:hypothetical protein
VSADGGVVWARADRPSRLIVEAAISDSFKDILQRRFVDALLFNPAVISGAVAIAAWPRAPSGRSNDLLCESQPDVRVVGGVGRFVALDHGYLVKNKKRNPDDR